MPCHALRGIIGLNNISKAFFEPDYPSSHWIFRQWIFMKMQNTLKKQQKRQFAQKKVIILNQVNNLPTEVGISYK